MTSSPKTSAEELLLGKLKDILLREDRVKVETELQEIRDPLTVRENVTPIIEEHLALFKENFPKEFELVVNKLIEEKIKNSQEEIVDSIYPILGKMIKKYINFQIQTLKDTVDEKIKTNFSPKMILWKIKSSLFGINASDSLFSELVDFRVEEIYVIQKNSGLLFGSASKEKTMDEDVLAGMLTAIKAFVEDAFKREQEDLESIQYGTYKIMLQSFYSYYIAIAISGTLSSKEEDELGNKILDFANRNLKELGTYPTDKTIEVISKALQEAFISSL